MYREVNGTRYENPHTARLEGLKQAERSKEARSKDEVDTLNFVYGANTDARQTLDPDKVSSKIVNPSCCYRHYSCVSMCYQRVILRFFFFMLSCSSSSFIASSNLTILI